MMAAASLAMAPFAMPMDSHFLAVDTLAERGPIVFTEQNRFWSSSLGIWVPVLDFPHSLFPATTE
jgi:hypothetical protein